MLVPFPFVAEPESRQKHDLHRGLISFLVVSSSRFRSATALVRWIPPPRLESFDAARPAFAWTGGAMTNGRQSRRLRRAVERLGRRPWSPPTAVPASARSDSIASPRAVPSMSPIATPNRPTNPVRIVEHQDVLGSEKRAPSLTSFGSRRGSAPRGMTKNT